MNIVPFEYQGREIRSIAIDGEPWFIPADPCAVLGHSNPSQAVTQHVHEDDVRTATLTIREGSRMVTRERSIINESGLYALIFGSTLPEAKAFKRWVTHEVIPSIRKTGAYGMQKQLTDEEIVAQALQITTAKVKELEAKITEAAPKVEYVDRHVAASDDAITVRVAATHLNVGEKELRERLLAAGWIHRVLIGQRWSGKNGRIVDEWEYRPSASHRGKFTLRAQHNAPRHHNGQVRQTLYVLAAALPSLRRLLDRVEVAA